MSHSIQRRYLIGKRGVFCRVDDKNKAKFSFDEWVQTDFMTGKEKRRWVVVNGKFRSQTEALNACYDVATKIKAKK